MDNVLGVLFDLLEKLKSPSGVEWFAALKRFLRKENPWEAAKEVVKSFTVNYEVSPREEALAPGKFKYTNPAIKNGPFPIGEGVGQRTLVGDLVGGLGYCEDIAEVQAKLAKKLQERGFGERPMNIREFAAFAGAHPELCKDKWIAILGSVGEGEDGGQCVAYFDGTDGSWSLNLDSVEIVWNDNWVFAVVRE